MWFFKKKPLEAVCVELDGIAHTTPLDSYKTFASQVYGCTPEDVEKAVAKHWASYEMGKLKPEEFWDTVGAEVRSMGFSHDVPGWKFKGIWDGIVADNITIHKDMLDVVRQMSAKKLRTVASSNMSQEVSVAYQKQGVFEPFSMAVLSCQIGLRKPDPAVFKRMCKLVRYGASQCLYIDKDPKNLEVAKAAGYKVIAFENVQDLRWELLQLGLLS